MINENARKWVKALRSGKYKQGKECLRNGERFCCLGVACELAKDSGVIKKYFGTDQFMPEKVREWLGLISDSGECACGTESLATANDNGITFFEIADLIESEPEGLFEKRAE